MWGIRQHCVLLQFHLPQVYALTLTHYISDEKFTLCYKAFIAAVTTDTEPSWFIDALSVPYWRNMKYSEINALAHNTITTRPPRKKAWGCKWVYKIKMKSNKSIERYKVRLVILGNTQVEGLDYRDFCPSHKNGHCSYLAIRCCCLEMGNSSSGCPQCIFAWWFIWGGLYETPTWFFSKNKGKVCYLQKSLHGLKQAPRCWFTELIGALKQCGFYQSYSNYSPFIYSSGSIFLCICTFVCGWPYHYWKRSSIS